MLQNLGCKATRESKCMKIIKTMVPHVLCNLGGYLFEWLEGSSNLSESSITFSGGTGFFNFAVSWKVTEFMILKDYFQKDRYVILSYYTIDNFTYP